VDIVTPNVKFARIKQNSNALECTICNRPWWGFCMVNTFLRSWKTQFCIVHAVLLITYYCIWTILTHLTLWSWF